MNIVRAIDFLWIIKLFEVQPRISRENWDRYRYYENENWL